MPLISRVDLYTGGCDAAVTIGCQDLYAVAAVQADSSHCKHAVAYDRRVVSDVTAGVLAAAAGYQLYVEPIDAIALVAHEQADLCLRTGTNSYQRCWYLCYWFGLPKYPRCGGTHLSSSQSYVGGIHLYRVTVNCASIYQLHYATVDAGHYKAQCATRVDHTVGVLIG